MNRTDIAELLLPPVGLIWLLPIAAAFVRSRAARALLLLAFAGLWLLGSPLFARMALRSLAVESDAPPTTGAAALLVLGGDVMRDERGYEAGAASEARVREAARLAKLLHLPVIVTGGPLDHGEPAVATLMAQSLAERGVESRVEDRAKDTCQNLRFGAAVAREAGLHGPLLVVTHAWHMRRALLAANLVGVPVLPAPLPLESLPRMTPRSFLPSPRGWSESYWALHEWLGVLAYRAGLCR
jgi:uncharacterized SAM-binding protein YcdF (DUF218 family)